jgi:hypothetical protein
VGVVQAIVEIFPKHLLVMEVFWKHPSWGLHMPQWSQFERLGVGKPFGEVPSPFCSPKLPKKANFGHFWLLQQQHEGQRFSLNTPPSTFNHL